MKRYLHECLALHPQVTELRYGKVERLDEVEGLVRRVLADGGELWDAIHAIYNNGGAFDAHMFGALAEEPIEKALKAKTWHRRWRTLAEHELIKGLLHVFVQIEPVSMVLRFVDPERFGIQSPPVADLLGVRLRRKSKDTYQRYLRSLRELGCERGFRRVADVEMALWALRLGVVEGRLPAEICEPLRKCYEKDVRLRQLQTRNLTVHLFSEQDRLDLATLLLGTDDAVAIAGQIAGIEFEQRVGKAVGVAKRGNGAPESSLNSMINALPDPALRPDCHRAREIRNLAIHSPDCVEREEVEFLIKTARKVPKPDG